MHEVDKKIAKKILEAEIDWGDWKTFVKNLFLRWKKKLTEKL